MRFVLAALVVSFVATASMKALDQPLALPTDNDAIFHGGGEAFYQHIERDYQGAKSTPWQGGQYGFVRDPIETSIGIVYTRFHEGIDIRPLHRDERGDPLDEIRAIADGTVVHVNPVPGYSNYGKYIVIEHHLAGANYYGLYGHLRLIDVRRGQQVHRGEHIAVMGYTGQGLNQERAHLHLELNVMLSRKFESWYNHFYRKDPNHNGLYNGINLNGLDIAQFYLAQHEHPSLTVPEFLSEEQTFYKVILPRAKHFDLPKLYPWMLTESAEKNPPAWQVSFNQAGMPLKIEPSAKSVRAPELSYIKKSPVDYSALTRGAVGGHGENAHLTESGMRLMLLLIYPN